MGLKWIQKLKVVVNMLSPLCPLLSTKSQAMTSGHCLSTRVYDHPDSEGYLAICSSDTAL